MLPPIEKRIIQTAKHRNLPLKHRAMSRNLELLNPDYEYLFFDDEDVEKFIDREFPEYRKVFDSFRFPIQRYDFFRYLAVYRLGGFYFDLDVLLATSLDGLLQNGSCVSVRRSDVQSVAAQLRDGLADRELRVRCSGRPPVSQGGDRQLREGAERSGMGGAR